MKNYYYILLLLLSSSCCFIGCNNDSIVEIVKDYYNARNDLNYQQIKTFLADSIKEIEGDNIMPYSKADYYKKFQWDSVFGPTYEIIEIEKSDGHVIATISVKSKRFEYLGNNPLQSKHKFSFKDNRIVQTETIDYIGVDWIMWQNNRDTLIKWVDENHSELTGFAYDMTKNGGENYLKAITLFADKK